MEEEWVLPRSPIADLYPESFSDYKIFGLRENGGPKTRPWKENEWSQYSEALFLFDLTGCIEAVNTTAKLMSLSRLLVKKLTRRAESA